MGLGWLLQLKGLKVDKTLSLVVLQANSIYKVDYITRLTPQLRSPSCSAPFATAASVSPASAVDGAVSEGCFFAETAFA